MEGSHVRVLVVEDNPDAADTLRLLLAGHGYEVLVARTGAEGLAAALAWHPGVVLCDIGLPGLDGWVLARALRADPLTAGTRLIAISGYSSDEDRRRSHEAGFDHHLAKGCDPAVLFGLLTQRP
jgi:CheY-like chemotaxis protein